MFDHLIAVLVHGSGYERIATPGCSDRTIRRRLTDWATAGHTKALLRIVLAAFDRMIGLDLDDLSVDGSITKSPGGGEVSGRSPVDRGEQGPKRSVAATGTGSRCTCWRRASVTTPRRCWRPRDRDLRHDRHATGRAIMHQDRGYDSRNTRDCWGSRASTTTSPARASGTDPGRAAVGGRAHHVRREALCCIPGSAGRNSEGGSWVGWLTWIRKVKGTRACQKTGGRAQCVRDGVLGGPA